MPDPTPTKDTKKIDPNNPPAWDGVAHTEKYCPLCAGYVNGNGCAQEVCPVRPR